MPRDRRPPGCPQEVYDAIDIFTDEELESLFAEFSYETGMFKGIYFEGPDGRACRFANPVKATALAVLEKHYREELYGDPDGWVPVQGLHTVIADDIVQKALKAIQDLLAMDEWKLEPYPVLLNEGYIDAGEQRSYNAPLD